jgi:stage III sporulation protein AD
MTEALRIAGFSAAAAMLCFTLRAANRQAGAAAAMAAGLMLFFAAVSQLSMVTETMQSLSRQAGVGDETMRLLLKLIAMAYITEFSAQACRDAGEEGLASKAALCGKMLLMAQTLPLISEISHLTLALAP